MSALKSIFYTIVGLICAYCAVVIGYWFYYKYNVKDFTTETGYINAMTDEKDETFFFIEANYYTNDAGTGKECFEVNFKGFTDEYLQTTYAVGTQSEGKPEFKKQHKCYVFLGQNNDWYVQDGKYYNYDTSEDQSFGDVTGIGAKSTWVVNLGTKEEPKPALLKINDNPWELERQEGIWSYLIRNDVFCLEKRLYDSFGSVGYGHYNLNMDLSKYFDIYLYNSETKKWSDTPTTDKQYVYIQVLLHKYENGLISAKQSLFNAYLGDPNYTVTESADYWKNTAQYVLTERDFEYTAVSASDLTYKAKIKSEAVEFLSLFYNLDIIVNINLDSTYLANNSIILVGLSEKPFDNLNIKEVNITSNSPTTLEVPNTTDYTYNLVNVTLTTGGAL